MVQKLRILKPITSDKERLPHELKLEQLLKQVRTSAFVIIFWFPLRRNECKWFFRFHILNAVWLLIRPNSPVFVLPKWMDTCRLYGYSRNWYVRMRWTSRQSPAPEGIRQIGPRGKQEHHAFGAERFLLRRTTREVALNVIPWTHS